MSTRPHREDRLRLLDAQEVAEWLGCSLKMVRKLTATRRLPAIKIGSLTRFDPTAISRFIESNRLEERE
jgi:excisionase family DNA binding protein